MTAYRIYGNAYCMILGSNVFNLVIFLSFHKKNSYCILINSMKCSFYFLKPALLKMNINNSSYNDLMVVGEICSPNFSILANLNQGFLIVDRPIIRVVAMFELETLISRFNSKLHLGIHQLEQISDLVLPHNKAINKFGISSIKKSNFEPSHFELRKNIKTVISQLRIFVCLFLSLEINVSVKFIANLSKLY